MQNVDLGHTKVMKIRQRETLNHQGAIIHEVCCCTAQLHSKLIIFDFQLFYQQNFSEKELEYGLVQKDLDLTF